MPSLCLTSGFDRSSCSLWRSCCAACGRELSWSDCLKKTKKKQNFWDIQVIEGKTHTRRFDTIFIWRSTAMHANYKTCIRFGKVQAVSCFSVTCEKGATAFTVPRCSFRVCNKDVHRGGKSSWRFGMKLLYVCKVKPYIRVQSEERW